MKAYGDRRTTGYGEITGKPSCRCCNGSYAKVGKSSNKDNALRGLKKSARQQSKIELKQELQDDIITRYSFQRAIDDYGSNIIEGYNEEVLYGFMWALRSIAPELGWADTDDDLSWNSWHGYNLAPRALSAIPSAYKNWSPDTNTEYTELLEKIIRERDD